MVNRVALATASVGVVVASSVLVTACSSTAGGSSSSHSPAKPKSSISHALGSKDATGDVKIGKITVDSVLGFPSAPVTVTNHSSKRSNYLIEISLESADGKTQIDTADVAVDNLEPGQSTVQKAQFTTSDKLPAGAKLVIKSLDRLASS